MRLPPKWAVEAPETHEVTLAAQTNIIISSCHIHPPGGEIVKVPSSHHMEGYAKGKL